MKKPSKNFILYVHISPSGKKYYGITSTSVSKRWNNGNGYKGQPYFYNAIRKYGWDNFHHIVLFDNLTKDEACRLEVEYIAKDKTNHQEYGYNMSDGGEFNHMSDKGKAKLSKDRKGVRHPERMTVLDDSWTNSVFVDVEECATSKPLCKNHTNGITVVCDSNTFKSIGEFIDCYKLEQSRVSNWFRGEYPVPRCYVEKDLHILGDNYVYEERYNKSNRMVELDGVSFNTVSDCAKAIGVDRHTIARWLNGKMPIPPDIKNRGLKYMDRPNYYYIKIKGD